MDIPSKDTPPQLKLKLICNNRNFLECQRENYMNSRNGLRNLRFKIIGKKRYKLSPKLKMYNVQFDIV